MGNSYASTPRVRKVIRKVSECYFLKVIFSQPFQKHCKTYPPHFQFQFNSETLENVQIPSYKPYINSYGGRLTEPTFGAGITTSEKFQFHMQFKCIEKNWLYYELFSFNLTLEHIQSDNFCL